MINNKKYKLVYIQFISFIKRGILMLLFFSCSSNLFSQGHPDWEQSSGYDELIDGEEICWSCPAGRMVNVNGGAKCQKAILNADGTISSYEYEPVFKIACKGVEVAPNFFEELAKAEEAREEKKEEEKIEEEIVIRKVTVLSPKSGETIYISRADKNPKIDIKVKVTDPDNGLYHVQVEHNILGSIQANGISISKGGGTGGGSLKISGPGKFTFQVTAQYESSDLHSSGLEQKTTTVNIKYGPTQVEIKELADIILEVAKKKEEVKAKIESVIQAPPDKMYEHLYQNVALDINQLGSQLNVINPILSDIEMFIKTDSEVSIKSGAKKIYDEGKKEAIETKEEIIEWKEQLQPYLDFAQPIVEVAKEILNWIDFEGIGKKVEAPTHEYLIVKSELDGVTLYLDKESKAVIGVDDNRNYFVKEIDGIIFMIKGSYEMISGDFDIDQEIDPIKRPKITAEGQYVYVEPLHTIWEFEVDRNLNQDILKVYDGPVRLTSRNGYFSTQEIGSNTKVTIGDQGIISKESLSKDEMRLEGNRFMAAMGGINPVDLKSTDQTERVSTQYGDLEIIPYLPTPDESITLLYTPGDDRNKTYSYEWYMHDNNGDDTHLGSGNRLQLNPLPVGEYNFRMDIIDEHGDVIYFIAPNLHVLGKEGSSNIQVNPDNNLWETSTYDEIMFYLPYVLGGLGILGILTFLYRRRGKSVGDPYYKDNQKSPPTHSEKKQESNKNRYCAQCGVQVKTSSKFCTGCGAKLDV